MRKNMRKVPPSVREKLARLSGNVVAGCARWFSRSETEEGGLKHLGVVLTADGLVMPETAVPSASRGRYSAENLHGRVLVRRDLAMETHYNTVLSPNWGDWSKGSHMVDLPYEAYPREFLPPRELEIEMSCPDRAAGRSGYVISFRVGEVLVRADRDFEWRLLSDLNLLQENVGACDVEQATTPVSEYSARLNVSWEILPPGSRDEAIARLFRGRTPTTAQQRTAQHRYEFFETLHPRRIVVGTSGFRRYFGALLEDNLVVFENVEYGNALYILYDRWQELSQKNRLDLLAGRYGRDFDRLVHRPGWEEKARKLIAMRRPDSA